MGAPYKFSELYNWGWWMMTFCYRTAPPELKAEYAEIIDYIGASGKTPGGPVARMGLAMWEFHYRYRWPANKTQQAAEENAFFHLRKVHKPMSNARPYPARLGIEAFIALREKVYGPPPPFLNGAPALEDMPKHPLRDALHRLDTLAQTSKRPFPAALLKLLMQGDPKGTEVIQAMVTAAESEETWRDNTRSPDLFDTARMNLNKALQLYHQHRWMVGTPYQAAYKLFRQQLEPTTPA